MSGTSFSRQDVQSLRRSLVEEARAIALQAAAEQREKLMARAREAEAAKAAAEAAQAAPAASAPSPALALPASETLASAGTPEVRRIGLRIGPVSVLCYGQLVRKVQRRPSP